MVCTIAPLAVCAERFAPWYPHLQILGKHSYAFLCMCNAVSPNSGAIKSSRPVYCYPDSSSLQPRKYACLRSTQVKRRSLQTVCPSCIAASSLCEFHARQVPDCLYIMQHIAMSKLPEIISMAWSTPRASRSRVRLAPSSPPHRAGISNLLSAARDSCR